MPEEPQLHKTCDKFQNIMFGMSRLIDLVFIYFFSNFKQESSCGTVRRPTPTPMGTFGEAFFCRNPLPLRLLEQTNLVTNSEFQEGAL